MGRRGHHWDLLQGNTRVLSKESSVHRASSLYQGPSMLSGKEILLFKPNADCSCLCLQVEAMFILEGGGLSNPLQLPR